MNPAAQRRIAELSPDKRELLQKRLGERVCGSQQGISRRSATGDPPLSFAQQRLWFLDQMAPGSAFYNMNVAIRLAARIDPAVLERALNEVVRRHESLRTTFAVVEGQPVQVIAPRLWIPLTVRQLGALGEAEGQAEAERLATEDARQPFDLSRGPLLRAALLVLGETDAILLVTLHHIISDGWSVNVLFGELSAIYAAYAVGQESPLPELALQYGDFAVWQREWLQGAVLAKQLAYWRTQLAELPVLELPTDRPRPAVQSFQGAQAYVTIPKELTEELKALAQREGVTLFMLLLAAFQTLLMRYSGQEDVVVGVPVANRRRAEVEGLIGFFVNNLVLRVRMEWALPFREALQRVKDVALDAYAHQDVPFEMLVEELKPQRDLSRNPLFQVTFQLLNLWAEPVEAAQSKNRSLSLETHTALFDLALHLYESAGGLSGGIEYSTDLFEAGTIARMAEHYEVLLSGIVGGVERRLGDLPLLTEGEWQQVVVEWNRTEADYSTDRSVVELIEAQVERTPQAVAVVSESESWSYGELNAHANRWARYLRGQGVGPETLVGIAVERSVAMVVGLLGILKAGGAYVPLDPGYPRERVRYMLEDSGAKVVLTERRWAEGLGGGDRRVVYVEELWAEGEASAENLGAVAGAHHLAYVIYTSGSTGRPKGVMIPHRALSNHMQWMQAEFPLTADDRVLQRTRCGFDASVWELYAPLVAGARLVIPPAAEQSDAAELMRIIQREQVTILQLVPSLLRVLLDEGGFESCRSLRRVFCGGEPLTGELRDRFVAVLPSELCNLYGPTEACIDATFHRCTAGEKQDFVPIGRPIANMKAFVLDQYLSPVPVGVAGELYLSGDGLARGYWNRPEYAEKFLPNPFLGGVTRMYRTGDIVRFGDDGALEFMRRSDDQVKLRGIRIELGEIESRLRQHAAVKHNVVVLQESFPSRGRLVAYLVCHPGPRPAITELKRFVQQELPDYMVPSSFVFLDTMPLTPNGKLDLRALPAPAKSRPQLETSFASPGTELETAIAGVWQEVLGLDRIGVLDNFFDLGGHSLLLVDVQRKLCDVLNIDVSIVDLFRYPSIRDIAGSLQSRERVPSSLTPAQDRAAKQRAALASQAAPPHPSMRAVRSVRAARGTS